MEMQLSERLDAMRCKRSECSTGLGFPIGEAELSGGGTGLGEGQEDLGEEIEEAWERRCCVHCGGVWLAPPADEDEFDSFSSVLRMLDYCQYSELLVLVQGPSFTTCDSLAVVGPKSGRFLFHVRVNVR